MVSYIPESCEDGYSNSSAPEPNRQHYDEQGPYPWGCTDAKTIRILIRPALPRRMQITKMDWHTSHCREPGMINHLSTLIPGNGTTQLLRQVAIVLRIATSTLSAARPCSKCVENLVCRMTFEATHGLRLGEIFSCSTLVVGLVRFQYRSLTTTGRCNARLARRAQPH